jgi:branched-chain amino acid transport system permease protein
VGLQEVANGVILGATIGLGAIGLTLTYSILRFANFTHGDFMTWGAYFVVSLLTVWNLTTGLGIGALGPFSFGWPFLTALAAAGALRRHGTEITLVIASLGASLALRHLLMFLYGPEPTYFTREIQIARPILPGVRVTPDQHFVLGLTAALVVLLHLLLTRTTLGRAMRATSENPVLAQVIGLDPARVVRWTWIIGGSLAAVGGIFVGLTVQVRPLIGFELLLPLFAAAILGGVGSVYGAVLGGLCVGLAESLAVPLIGAEYRAAVAFVVLLLILLVRPQGLLGGRGDAGGRG